MCRLERGVGSSLSLSADRGLEPLGSPSTFHIWSVLGKEIPGRCFPGTAPRSMPARLAARSLRHPCIQGPSPAVPGQPWSMRLCLRGAEPRGEVTGASSPRWGGDDPAVSKGQEAKLQAKEQRVCVWGSPPPSQAPRQSTWLPGSLWAHTSLHRGLDRAGIHTRGTHLRVNEWGDPPTGALGQTPGFDPESRTATSTQHSCRELRRPPGEGACMVGPRGLRAVRLLESVVLHLATLPPQSCLPTRLPRVCSACSEAFARRVEWFVSTTAD